MDKEFIIKVSNTHLGRNEIRAWKKDIKMRLENSDVKDYVLNISINKKVVVNEYLKNGHYNQFLNNIVNNSFNSLFN